MSDVKGRKLTSYNIRIVGLGVWGLEFRVKDLGFSLEISFLGWDLVWCGVWTSGLGSRDPVWFLG